MLLVLDTSGPLCSAAIAKESRIVASMSEDIGRGHAERLMPLLEELLADAKLSWTDLTKIACTTGPGSFTGLRVGLATAKGLALGLECPCQGISVFEALAFGQKGPFAVTIDARRDQIWMQVFAEDGAATSEPCAVSAKDAANAIPHTITRLTGSAAPQLAAQNDRFSVVDDAPSPSIEGLVGAAHKHAANAAPPVPLYLRAPDAKPQSAAVPV